MRADAAWHVVMCAVTLLAGCRQTQPVKVEAAAKIEPVDQRVAQTRTVRATGKIRAVRELAILAPQIAGQTAGQTGRLTLTRLAPNGAKVAAGDLVAEFDRTQQLDNARESLAKYEDL